MATNPAAILHVDMDAFYAAVEQRDRPELRGQAVIVGGVQGRGVVCAASYEARKFGVHSAMPTGQARRLCPHGIFLPMRMQHYVAISQQIRAILFSFTPLVEPLSLDEAFLDVTGCEGLFGPAPEIGRKIKERIRRELELTASVGVAPNKFLAKLASDFGKPDGFVVLEPTQVRAFLDPLPIGRLWGVGAKGEKKLRALGIQTVGQLASLPEAILIDHFGSSGANFRRLALGSDERTVEPDRDAKSISTETTFAVDIADRRVLRVWLLDLVDQMTSRLRAAGLKARRLDMKIRSSDFRTRMLSEALPEPTDVTQVCWQTAVGLFDRGLDAQWLPLRLLGVGATNLTRETAVQRDLFEYVERQRQGKLDQAIDAIRGQFGAGSIQRGSLLEKESNREAD